MEDNNTQRRTEDKKGNKSKPTEKERQTILEIQHDERVRKSQDS
ncbi:hypothetical protein LCGC14_0808020 [marine sediment metagenome]|uniref:Uncharacterized protein n=1 Tax=marine sediment metagenome TaxID=412755 RepID=A0A0F9SV40_9ZZZZ